MGHDDHPEQDYMHKDSTLDLESRRVTFGQCLRMLREEQGVSVESLSEITRISHVFIEALESGQFEKLPGRVFGRGFVQNIAKNFSVDPAPLIDSFCELWEATLAPSVLKVEIKNKPSNQRTEQFWPMLAAASSLIRRGALVKVALPVAAVGLFSYFVASRSLVQHALKNFSSSKHSISNIKAKPLDLRPNAQARLAAVESTGKPSLAANTGESTETLSVAALTSGESASKPPEDKVEVAPIAALKHTSPIGDASGAVVLSTTPENPQSAHLSIPASSENEQTLVLTVTDPVRIKLDVDQGPPVTRELQPDTYTFAFNKKADMLIYDAAAVKISFNGRSLGALGSKGRVRRLSFQSQPPTSKSL
jgi:cytoskeletal protein RodZ